MKNRNVLLASLFSGALLCSNITFAMPEANSSSNNRSTHHHKHPMKQLTEAQRQQIRAMMKTHRAEFKILYKKNRALMKQLVDTMKRSNSTMADLQPIINQIKEVKAEQTQLKVKAHFEIYKKTGILLPFKKPHHRKHRMHQQNANPQQR